MKLNLRQLTRSPLRQFVASLLGLSAVALVLLLISFARNQSLADWYLAWNLFLAWLPLVFVARLRVILRVKPWSSWEGIVFTLLWLLFLPNSFYMVSDFIHLRTVAPGNILYDAVMFMSFISAALIAGYASLYWVHTRLRLRLRRLSALGIVTLVLLACSFAIYLGRDLRWNSWDVLIQPAGLLFDISERILHPLAHGDALGITALFFVFLGSLYVFVLTLVDSLRRPAAGRPKGLLH